MAFTGAHTVEVTRLRVREFNKIMVGGGTRLLKCEACGRLTDRGAIVDRDIVDEGVAGHLEKTGYERWILCPECSKNIINKANTFTDELIKNIQQLAK
jgi:DNA-directed RNA polymerase subunit RPC12/RpoP